MFLSLPSILVLLYRKKSNVLTSSLYAEKGKYAALPANTILQAGAEVNNGFGVVLLLGGCPYAFPQKPYQSIWMHEYHEF